jgi:hypothetical protein
MSFRTFLTIGLVSALALGGVGASVQAQSGKAGGGKGAADSPVDGSSFEVSGVEVDVRGANADAARYGGWRIAQRKGWEKLAKRLTGKSSSLSDSALDALVSGIIVEQEQIGPTRYIAKLGVLFDRGRAAAILGVSGQVTRSPAMLLVPVQWSGGVGTTFERDTAWQRAWERFRIGNSAIDYVRLAGKGPDALLLNAGQIGRRGRGWWRAALDQYGATDVLTAEVSLRHEYPGGPVIGTFVASHGPDKLLVTRFSLRVENGDGVDSLLDAGIARINSAFEAALSAGALKSDPLLAWRAPAEKTEEETKPEEATDAPTPEAVPVDTTASFTVQIETPSAASVTASESAVRGVPGVRSANTTSLALGGISVMRVSYDGSIGSLRAALEGRGWIVQEGQGVLRIRRPGGGGSGPAPSPSPTGGTTGG